MIGDIDNIGVLDQWMALKFVGWILFFALLIIWCKENPKASEIGKTLSWGHLGGKKGVFQGR